TPGAHLSKIGRYQSHCRDQYGSRTAPHLAEAADADSSALRTLSVMCIGAWVALENITTTASTVAATLPFCLNSCCITKDELPIFDTQIRTTQSPGYIIGARKSVLDVLSTASNGSSDPAVRCNCCIARIRASSASVMIRALFTWPIKSWSDQRNSMLNSNADSGACDNVSPVRCGEFVFETTLARKVASR